MLLRSDLMNGVLRQVQPLPDTSRILTHYDQGVRCILGNRLAAVVTNRQTAMQIKKSGDKINTISIAILQITPCLCKEFVAGLMYRANDGAACAGDVAQGTHNDGRGTGIQAYDV
jgi:hypothetical protein